MARNFGYTKGKSSRVGAPIQANLEVLMLFNKSQVNKITLDEGTEIMGNQYLIEPWMLKFGKLGALGLALSVSPLVMDIALGGEKSPAQPKAAQPVKAETDGYPLDKQAAARRPEGRKVVSTLEAALEAAYQNNTEIKELQAAVRSRDEGVPQALAGWRPTVYANASIAGRKDIQSGDIKTSGDQGLTNSQSGDTASTASADITLKQNLFNGGGDVARTCQAESLVQAARAQLVDKEREILFKTVQSYFAVVAKTAELEYRKSNEVALRKTLEATRDKFNVGEETRTSIAQAEANLADGTAQRETTEAQLLAVSASFEEVTGTQPGKLQKPATLLNLLGGLKEAIEIAKKNNPAILTALHQEKADRSAIKANDAGLLPKVDLQGQISRTGVNTKRAVPTRSGGAVKTNDFTTAQSVSVNLTVPLYEAGGIRAKTRELRETAEKARLAIETARRKVTQQLVEAWETYIAAKANVQQYKAQVNANQVSLEGTRQEMLVGSKILLDVLNAQRELVNSQLNLVRAEQNYHQSAYSILALMGRLNAFDMKLKVKRYDPTVHYHDVRNSW